MNLSRTGTESFLSSIHLSQNTETRTDTNSGKETSIRSTGNNGTTKIITRKQANTHELYRPTQLVHRAISSTVEPSTANDERQRKHETESQGEEATDFPLMATPQRALQTEVTTTQQIQLLKQACIDLTNFEEGDSVENHHAFWDFFSELCGQKGIIGKNLTALIAVASCLHPELTQNAHNLLTSRVDGIHFTEWCLLPPPTIRTYIKKSTKSHTLAKKMYSCICNLYELLLAIEVKMSISLASKNDTEKTPTNKTSSVPSFAPQNRDNLSHNESAVSLQLARKAIMLLTPVFGYPDNKQLKLWIQDSQQVHMKVLFPSPKNQQQITLQGIIAGLLNSLVLLNMTYFEWKQRYRHLLTGSGDLLCVINSLKNLCELSKSMPGISGPLRLEAQDILETPVCRIPSKQLRNYLEVLGIDISDDKYAQSSCDDLKSLALCTLHLAHKLTNSKTMRALFTSSWGTSPAYQLLSICAVLSEPREAASAIAILVPSLQKPITKYAGVPFTSPNSIDGTEKHPSETRERVSSKEKKTQKNSQKREPKSPQAPRHQNPTRSNKRQALNSPVPTHCPRPLNQGQMSLWLISPATLAQDPNALKVMINKAMMKCQALCKMDLTTIKACDYSKYTEHCKIPTTKLSSPVWNLGALYMVGSALEGIAAVGSPEEQQQAQALLQQSCLIHDFYFWCTQGDKIAKILTQASPKMSTLMLNKLGETLSNASIFLQKINDKHSINVQESSYTEISSPDDLSATELPLPTLEQATTASHPVSGQHTPPQTGDYQNIDDPEQEDVPNSTSSACEGSKQNESSYDEPHELTHFPLHLEKLNASVFLQPINDKHCIDVQESPYAGILSPNDYR